MMEKFYITTAIPYVNAAPHLGHVMEFIQTDVIARYQNSRNKEVQLVTGADENSLKNVQAAEKKGITVVELCDKNSEIFKQTAVSVGLSFTKFQRTSNKKAHWPGVQKLWRLCDKNQDIYVKKYRGLYCVGCEAFYEEGELADGICPEHKTKPEIIEEENYFFKLTKYQEKLERIISTDEIKILPETRKNEVLSFIKSGLKDFSISRSITRAKGWGVPVPKDDKQIQYVWFDALGTYITGIGYGTDEQMFQRFWPADVHVIGKGILRFHAVYWPAILLSAGLKLPKTIFVHGYITVEGQKMSKSLGNIIDPNLLLEQFGLEPLRYFLLSDVPTFEDGDFSYANLIQANNAELLSNLGNLVNRTLVFVKNNFNGKIPAVYEFTEADTEFLESQEKLIEEITQDLEKTELKEALHKLMNYSRNANRYFQDNKPWELVKTPENRKRAETVISILVHQVKTIAIICEPFIPHTSKEIFEQLALSPQKWADIEASINAGHEIGTPKVLFRKIEQKEVEELRKRFAGKQEQQKIEFSDLDLEVGEIISIERHPNAEKLYVERIKLANGERQIVSGLVEYYLPEQLLGKKVIVLKNLKPAQLRGIESQGMVLAAEGNEQEHTHGENGGKIEQGALEVITCQTSKFGEKILREGEKSVPKQLIDFKEFTKIKMEITDFQAVCDGKALVSSSGEKIKLTNVKEGRVC